MTSDVAVLPDASQAAAAPPAFAVQTQNGLLVYVFANATVQPVAVVPSVIFPAMSVEPVAAAGEPVPQPVMAPIAVPLPSR